MDILAPCVDMAKQVGTLPQFELASTMPSFGKGLAWSLTFFLSVFLKNSTQMKGENKVEDDVLD